MFRELYQQPFWVHQFPQIQSELRRSAMRPLNGNELAEQQEYLSHKYLTRTPQRPWFSILSRYVESIADAVEGSEGVGLSGTCGSGSCSPGSRRILVGAGRAGDREVLPLLGVVLHGLNLGLKKAAKKAEEQRTRNEA